MRVTIEEAAGNRSQPGLGRPQPLNLSNTGLPSQQTPGKRHRSSLPRSVGHSEGGLFFRPKTQALCIAAFIFAAAAQTAFGAPGVTARLDRNTVTLGENATLSISFENLNPSGAPNLPVIPGLAVAFAGPSSQVSFDNAGNSFSQFSYNYALTASQAGDFTIPAITVTANGQNFVTTPLKLKVLPAPAVPPEAANQSAFLKLAVPKNEIYLGEPILVQINLYSLFFSEARMPQLQTEGFTTGKILQQRQSRTRVGNQVFVLTPMVTFVSAVRPGQLTLGPVTMQVAVPKPNARRNIFNEIVDWQYANLTSEAQPIKVLPLPRTNVPPTFHGAVGTFNMTVSAGPTNLTVGDPITVKVILSGDGMLETLTLPAQPAWNDFKAYPPNS